MRSIILVFAISCVLSFSLGCASERSCLGESDYRVEFSTQGGFTGMETGVTIECSGSVKKWERRLNSPKVVIDSLQASPSIVIALDRYMTDSSLFDFVINKSGNYTTTLVLSRNGSTHIIAYPSSEDVSRFPESIQAILSEIEKINQQK